MRFSPTRRGFLYGAAAVAIGASAISQAQRDTDVAPLSDLARKRGIRFGTAASGAGLSDSDVADLIRRQCDVLTPENALKWRWFEPAEGEIDDDEAREIARFARRNDMELRGHCFVWNNDDRLPEWLVGRGDAMTRNGGKELVEAMERHAQRLDRRFSRVASWDVLNEAIDPDSGQLRNSVLTRALGERHIDIAFDIMRDRFPKAQLVYNDSMTWGSQSAHRTGVLRLLESALARGVPMQALGIQSHLAKTISRPVFEREWYDFLREVYDMGLTVLLTELDCGDRAVSASDETTRDREIADFTKRYLDLTLSFPNVNRMVLWSISDRTSYMNRPSFPEHRRRNDELPMRGHPFDGDLKPKPMYTAIAEALAAAPSVRTR